MKDNKKHIKKMQELAESGWQQMHETLLEHGLSADVTELNTPSKKRTLYLLFAACVFFILILSYPFIFNSKRDLSFHENAHSQASSLKKNMKAAASEDEINRQEKEITALTSKQKQFIHQKINSRLAQLTEENSLQILQNQKAVLLNKFTLEKTNKITIPSCETPIDTSIKIERTGFPQKQSKRKTSKKIQVFAGAGINVSTAKNYPDLFNAKNLNVHPKVTVIIPLNEKLNLRTGLSAFSMIHGKEVSAREKEIVNNFNSNVYYSINTTSIIKASYFDLPLTLDYCVDKNWSIGTGLELSKLYKVNIKEEKQSFDYSNTLAAATVSQYSSTPRAATLFQRKLEIKKFEPRFVLETSYQLNHFLLSAGYHCAIGKTISLKDSYNTMHQYRNEYFKIGIQYQIKGEK